MNKCIIPDCPEVIDEDKIFCREHWDRLPNYLQHKIIFAKGITQNRTLAEAMEYICEEDLELFDSDD